MKKCFKCSKVKPISEFYRHSGMSDGRLGKCKHCTIKESIRRKKENIESYREWNRKWSLTWAKKNPEKIKAYKKVLHAVKTGKLIRKPCVKCGQKAQAHHEDYSKPLIVKWLCPKHHSYEHKKTRVL